MDLREARCKDVNWIELAHYKIQQRDCEHSITNAFRKTREFAHQFICINCSSSYIFIYLFI
jgi:hypothetical protein